ncbi:MAG: PcfJ domain-containing protein [Cetobacterium sp.]|nr:PcfJ domain-containing protein [Cetobacterium sp.]
MSEFNYSEVVSYLKKDNTELGKLLKFLIENLSNLKCEKSYDFSNTFFDFRLWDYRDLQKESFNGMVYPCSVRKNTNTIDIKYMKNGSRYLKIFLRKHNRVAFDIEKSLDDDSITRRKFYPYSEGGYIYTFIIFSDLSMFAETKNGKIYPATLKSISNSIYVSENDNIKRFMNLIYEFFSTKHILFKDILKENEENIIDANIKINDIWKYNTKVELLKGNIKNVEVPKKFNKLRLHTGFLILKASKYIDKNDMQKLYILDDKVEFLYRCSLKDQIIELFTLYCIHTLKHENMDCDSIYDYKGYISDYIRMTINFSKSKKVNLKIKSVKRILEEHDRLTKEMYEKETPTIKIKKNSKFKNLKLSYEFEKIKTKKRLIQETREQKHCVWSYAEDINKDKCMIYSTIFEGNRYTLEIRINRKKYKLAQIKGFRNSLVPQELIDSIEKQLKNQRVA